MKFFGLDLTLPPFLDIFPKYTTKIYRFETNKICNVIFWIGNDPPLPPSDIFQKNIHIRADSRPKYLKIDHKITFSYRKGGGAWGIQHLFGVNNQNWVNILVPKFYFAGKNCKLWQLTAAQPQLLISFQQQSSPGINPIIMIDG